MNGLQNRGSMRPGQGASGTNRLTRSSMAASSSLNQNLPDSFAQLSVSRNSDARSSLKQGNRRSSVFNSRLSTIGSSSGPVKDPRPIRDKAYQANAIRSLINFLVQAGFNQVLTPASLKLPSGKEFQAIFRFLHGQLDPGYIYGKNSVKFEEEVPNILRGLRYPFAASINKTHLFAVGSPHAWPTLLAILTWMVELILCLDQLENEPEAQDFASSLEETRDPDKIFYDFLTSKYSPWLESGDENEPSPPSDDLYAMFQSKNETVQRAYEKLLKENEALVKEYQMLTSTEAPVIVLERENVVLAADKEKYEHYISHVTSKHDKLVESIHELHEQLGEQEKLMQELNDEKISLQIAIDAQEISPADIDRMNLEREQLSKAIETTNQKLELLNDSVWQKEILLQKKHDQMDKVVTNFNSTVYKLGVVDRNTQALKLEMEFNIHGNTPEMMIVPDIQQCLKPMLSKIKAKYVGSTHGCQDESLALMEGLDRLSEQCGDKIEELNQLETQIKRSNQLYGEEKNQISTENSNNTKEIESLEKDISKWKIENTGLLQQSQQEAQNVTHKFEELQRIYQDNRESKLQQMIKGLGEVIAFKSKITEMLSDLKNLVEAEHLKSLEDLEILSTLN